MRQRDDGALYEPTSEGPVQAEQPVLVPPLHVPPIRVALNTRIPRRRSRWCPHPQGRQDVFGVGDVFARQGLPPLRRSPHSSLPGSRTPSCRTAWKPPRRPSPSAPVSPRAQGDVDVESGLVSQDDRTSCQARHPSVLVTHRSLRMARWYDPYPVAIRRMRELSGKR